jgi:hypothetical protein
VKFILDSVITLASDAPSYLPRYDFDARRAIFFPREA